MRQREKSCVTRVRYLHQLPIVFMFATKMTALGLHRANKQTLNNNSIQGKTFQMHTSLQSVQAKENESSERVRVFFFYETFKNLINYQTARNYKLKLKIHSWKPHIEYENTVGQHKKRKKTTLKEFHMI